MRTGELEKAERRGLEKVNQSKRARTKRGRKRGLSLCNFVREPLQQVQQADFF